MKTLIINGSPKKNGDTQALIDAFVSGLSGEYRIISAADRIAPCMDCRYCWKKAGCAVNDDMQAVYEYLPDCDNVVLASPVWFSSLSAPALTVASRLQRYFTASFFRKEKTPLKPKKGVLLIVGAQPGTEEGPIANARIILGLLNIRKEDIRVVRSMQTDRIPASEDRDALAAARQAAAAL
ncbi:MAG: flavodoxin family protein [Eubacteriales bacterium]